MAETKTVYAFQFFPILAILFIGLKLGGVIAWSWWWVLAPLWGPLALLGLIFLGILIVLTIFEGVKK